ncbi:MAG: hypothetical protein JW844_06460 [Candidatus Omnitrophica bacterium]|nr:hypothetical protein [Candidatus Omnitrophota bacterium]
MNKQKKTLFPVLAGVTALIALSAVSFSGCGVSYPAGTAAQSVSDMCKKEYDISVKAKVYGKTLWVYLPLDQLVDANGQIDEKTGDTIENAALCVHRVLSSTDEDLDFYVLIASDIKTLGAEFTLIGHVYDIMRVRLLDISRGEYQRRMLRDLKINPAALGDAEGHHIRLSDLDMARFLAEQFTRRIKLKFENEKKLNQKFVYKSGKWYVQNNTFILNLDIAEKEPSETLPLRSSKHKEPNVLDIALKELAFILRRYGFEDYEKVRIANFATNETRILTKEEMKQIR